MNVVHKLCPVPFDVQSTWQGKPITIPRYQRFFLECGHYTPYEEFVAGKKPRRMDCEVCSDWRYATFECDRCRTVFHGLPGTNRTNGCIRCGSIRFTWRDYNEWNRRKKESISGDS